MDRRTTPQVDIYLVPYMFLWGREWACREKKKRTVVFMVGKIFPVQTFTYTHIYIYSL